jgi:hypothetical protein
VYPYYLNVTSARSLSRNLLVSCDFFSGQRNARNIVTSKNGANSAVNNYYEKVIRHSSLYAFDKQALNEN